MKTIRWAKRIVLVLFLILFLLAVLPHALLLTLFWIEAEEDPSFEAALEMFCPRLGNYMLTKLFLDDPGADDPVISFVCIGQNALVVATRFTDADLPRHEFYLVHGIPDETPVTQTDVLTIKSTILWAQIGWRDQNHVKVALVVDDRATYDKPIAQVGSIHIDYEIFHAYEPKLWPRGFVQTTPQSLIPDLHDFLHPLPPASQSKDAAPRGAGSAADAAHDDPSRTQR
jgi:hypothetical protein